MGVWEIRMDFNFLASGDGKGNIESAGEDDWGNL